MDEFVRLFRAFLYRDLAFILGGSIVIASVACALPGGFWAQVNNLEKLPSPFLVLFAATAYVVGYAVQDIGAVLGITFTAHPFKPERLPCWFYCRTVLPLWVFWRSVPGLLVLGLFLLGVSLVCLGWVKAMQQLQFYQAIHLANYPLKDAQAAIVRRTEQKQ
jgi:hypothetical protein